MLIALFRTVVLYLLIILGIRLMGKRQIGELEPSELVFTLLIADLAAVPMQDFGIPLLTGVVPILTLLCVTFLLSVLTAKSVRARRVLCGRPSIVVRDGRPDQREMGRNRFTLDELAEELRLQGVTDITTVKYAILETGGQLTVVLRAADQPLTAGQFGLKPTERGLPALIVSDGVLLRENLARRGLNEGWLRKELDRHRVKDVREVFLLSVDEAGGVVLVKKEGKEG